MMYVREAVSPQRRDEGYKREQAANNKTLQYPVPFEIQAGLMVKLQNGCELNTNH